MSSLGYFDNPSALKIDLMLRGIRVVDPLAKAWVCGTSVDMLLPEETLVNIPCSEEFTEHSPYELRRRKEAHYITDGTSEMSAEILPVPEFLQPQDDYRRAFWRDSRCSRQLYRDHSVSKVRFFSIPIPNAGTVRSTRTKRVCRRGILLLRRFWRQ